MSTKLTSSITDLSTTVFLMDTTDFPMTGIISVGSELIKYEFAGDTAVRECTRGYLGTSAASHAAGTVATLFANLSSVSEKNSILSLSSPSELSQTEVDNFDVISVSSVGLDVLVLNLPNPTASDSGRILTVSHTAGSLGSVTINGTTLPASESISFTWNGASWTSPHDATGGGGITQLTGDVGAGPGSGSQVATVVSLAGGTITADINGIELNPGLALWFDAGLHHAITYDNGIPAINLYSDDAAGIRHTVGGAAITETKADGLHLTVPSILASSNLFLSIGGANVLEVDNSATAGNTRLLIWDVDSGALQRVTVGAADSGGVGFKVLRIPN